MKVKMRTRARGPEPGDNWDPEIVRDVSDETGRSLILGGYATEIVEDKLIEPEKPKKPASPPEPESAMIEPREETADLPAPRKRRRKRNADLPES